MFIYIMRLIGVQYKGQLYGGSVQVTRDLLQLQSIYTVSAPPAPCSHTAHRAIQLLVTRGRTLNLLPHNDAPSHHRALRGPEVFEARTRRSILIGQRSKRQPMNFAYGVDVEC